jgi:hypothetical protein
MIPPFSEHGELPPGTYEATFTELAERFAFSATRRRLLERLAPVLRALQGAQVVWVYVDGSFVTTKREPGDIDIAWVPGPGFQRSRLPVEFSDETGALAGQADIPELDVFPDLMGGVLATQLFCRVKGHPQRRKGLILLGLREDPLTLPGRS